MAQELAYCDRLGELCACTATLIVVKLLSQQRGQSGGSSSSACSVRSSARECAGRCTSSCLNKTLCRRTSAKLAVWSRRYLGRVALLIFGQGRCDAMRRAWGTKPVRCARRGCAGRRLRCPWGELPELLMSPSKIYHLKSPFLPWRLG